MLQSLGVPPRVILLVCCDFLTLFACTFFVLCLRALWGDLNITSYDWMLSMLLLAPFMGLALGLYGVISLPAYVESRKLCALSTLTFGLILALLFAGKASVAYSRIVLVGAWLLSIFLLPVTRRFCRHYFGKFRWWGTPLVILDRSNTGRELWHYLKRHPWPFAGRHLHAAPGHGRSQTSAEGRGASPSRGQRPDAAAFRCPYGPLRP